MILSFLWASDHHLTKAGSRAELPDGYDKHFQVLRPWSSFRWKLPLLSFKAIERARGSSVIGCLPSSSRAWVLPRYKHTQGGAYSVQGAQGEWLPLQVKVCLHHCLDFIFMQLLLGFLLCMFREKR